MLHELLVALSGVSGSIIVDKKEQGFQVGRNGEYSKIIVQMICEKVKKLTFCYFPSVSAGCQ